MPPVALVSPAVTPSLGPHQGGVLHVTGPALQAPIGLRLIALGAQCKVVEGINRILDDIWIVAAFLFQEPSADERVNFSFVQQDLDTPQPIAPSFTRDPHPLGHGRGRCFCGVGTHRRSICSALPAVPRASQSGVIRRSRSRRRLYQQLGPPGSTRQSHPRSGTLSQSPSRASVIFRRPGLGVACGLAGHLEI